MRPQPLFSSGRSRWAASGIAALAALAMMPAHAQVSCKLLEQTEIESALKEWAPSGKASKFNGTTQDAGGTLYDICGSDVVKPNGNLQVKIVVVTNLSVDGNEGIKIRDAATAREGQWKVAGARLEQGTVGKAMCTSAGRPSVAAFTRCTIPRSKGYVEVEVTAPNLKEVPSMETVGALVQKANTRL